MLFFETSAKTGFNIDDCFQQSCKSISKKINEDFYDLTNEVF
jgi:GTPase SAR1 family protein